MRSSISLALLATATSGVQGSLFGILFGNSNYNINNDVTDTGIAAHIGSLNQLTTVQRGVTYWLAGLGVHNVFGNLDNYGKVVISQSKVWLPIYLGQISGWVGLDSSNGNLHNYAGASIHVTDVTASTGSVAGWLLNSMQNEGSLQFCGRGDLLGSNFKLVCRSNCVNEGLITFEEVYGNNGLGSTWKNYILTPSSLTPSQTITNNGAVLIRNMRLELIQNYLGDGCWIVAENAVMYMLDGAGLFQNPGYGMTLSGQSISFTDSTGVVHMDPHVYLHNENFGAKVYGFQTGNVFEFLELIKDFSYSGNVLTVSFFSSYSVRINIGYGYRGTFSKILRTSNYGIFNAITYSGNSIGTTAPSQCYMTMPVCGAITNCNKIADGLCDDKISCKTVEDPPTVDTPIEVPPITDTPAEDPPTTDKPNNDPPNNDPPTTDTPTDTPTGGIPDTPETPVDDPPTTDTPVDTPTDGTPEVPVEDPPITDIPTDTPTDPPTDTPTDGPPKTPETPADDPPTTDTPIDDPPIDVPVETTTTAHVTSSKTRTSAMTSTTTKSFKSKKIKSSTTKSTSKKSAKTSTWTTSSHSSSLSSSATMSTSIPVVKVVSTSVTVTTSSTHPTSVSQASSNSLGTRSAIISSVSSSAASSNSVTVVRSGFVSSSLTAPDGKYSTIVKSDSVSTDRATATSSVPLGAQTSFTRASGVSSAARSSFSSSSSSSSSSCPPSPSSPSSSILFSKSSVTSTSTYLSTSSSLSSSASSSASLSSSSSRSSLASASTYTPISSSSSSSTSSSTYLPTFSTTSLSTPASISSSILSSSLSLSTTKAQTSSSMTSNAASSAKISSVNIGTSTSMAAPTTAVVSSSTKHYTTSSMVTLTKTISSTAPTTTGPATFYIKSSCDGSCLGHYAADGQIYSNTYTSSINEYDSFYLNGTQLYSYTLGTLCVASQSGGTQTQFQCSNDLDHVNGVPVIGGFGFVNTNHLTYKSSSDWFGCGVLNLADHYEPTGLTYATTMGDPAICRSCDLIRITDVSQCSNQLAASKMTVSSTLPAADFDI